MYFWPLIWISEMADPLPGDASWPTGPAGGRTPVGSGLTSVKYSVSMALEAGTVLRSRNDPAMNRTEISPASGIVPVIV